MKDLNPQQFELFPDLHTEDYHTSIRSMPEFDRALKNFISLSDFGAFVQYSISGLEKSYSLNVREVAIDTKLLSNSPDRISPTLYLFPNTIRNQINRIKYEIRGFFNAKTCIQTSFGPFLYRHQFHRWYLHRKKVLEQLHQYLKIEIGEKQFEKYVVQLWEDGMNWISAILKIQNPYILTIPSYDEICEHHTFATDNNLGITSLDPSNPEYIVHFLVLKTQHIPLTINAFIDKITINSAFNTLHLDYLKNAKLDTIDDVRVF